jgi:hypothetical protein
MTAPWVVAEIEMRGDTLTAVHCHSERNEEVILTRLAAGWFLRSIDPRMSVDMRVFLPGPMGELLADLLLALPASPE